MQELTNATGTVVAAQVRRAGRREGPLAGRVDRLMQEVGAAVRVGMPDEVQAELARLVALLPVIEDAGTPHLFPPIEAAVRSLLASEPNLTFARRVRRSTWQKFRRRYRLLPLMLGLGVGILVFASAYFAIFALLGPRQRFLGFDEPTVTNIALVTLTGALGASVSLVLRIRDFSKLKEIDAEVLLYTAIFKPILGAAFSLFVFLALNAGIITINIAQGREKFLYGAAAFVAGFSERFAKDVISKVAGSIDDDRGDAGMELAAVAATAAPAAGFLGGTPAPGQDGGPAAAGQAPAVAGAVEAAGASRPRPPARRRRVSLRVRRPRRKPPAGS